MEIQVRVPFWVKEEDEGIVLLFAFLRKIIIEYDFSDKPIDLYGYDIRRILDNEGKYIHEYILSHVDTKYCKVGKLNRDHFVFQLKNIVQNTKLVTIKQHKMLIRWAYLMGCTNYNLLEPTDSILEGRPAYSSMFRLERDMFEFTRDE